VQKKEESDLKLVCECSTDEAVGVRGCKLATRKKCMQSGGAIHDCNGEDRVRVHLLTVARGRTSIDQKSTLYLSGSGILAGAACEPSLQVMRDCHLALTNRVDGG